MKERIPSINRVTGYVACVLVMGACILPIRADDESMPPVQVRERVTPWGVVVERERFYEKNGEKVEHGLQETFCHQGTPVFKFRYSHGEEDGVSEMFYEGTGVKQSEMFYAEGVEDGWSRTWGPDGKLLFEGFMNLGERWDGWFEMKRSGGLGQFHRRSETWTIVQWIKGKKVPGSSREVEVSRRVWTPGTLPDHKMFLRWNWPSYRVKSQYPFMDSMPSYIDVPILIEWIGKKGDRIDVAGDQLEALTRVQFGSPGMWSEEERAAAMTKWRTWWEEVGKHRPEWQEKWGTRDAEAWNLVRWDRELPVPDEAMVIPEEYAFEARYSSGDYGGVTSETITIRRDGGGAELARRFSTRLNGPVTEERWLPFEAADADRVVRAIGYLVDRPWLINDEAEIERLYWESEKKEPEAAPQDGLETRKLKGRESYGPPYYPNSSYELRDAAGRLWWNSDPDKWHGGNPDRFNETYLPVPGVVVPFLAAMFPESKRSDGKDKAGWGER